MSLLKAFFTTMFVSFYTFKTLSNPFMILLLCHSMTITDYHHHSIMLSPWLTLPDLNLALECPNNLDIALASG
jgi:hypothetical protein